MSWINFLRVMADDFDLSPEQTEVFLIRFDEENKQKAEKEMEKLFLENQGLDKPAYEKRRKGIYGKFTWGKQKPNGSRELINAGPHKAKKLRKWLESKYDEQQVIQESDSHSSTATVVDATAIDWRRQFRSLIDIKTEGFVGRQYVFDKIENFLTNKPNGYFTIEGDPGMGKSTILAEYVRRHECVAHFNDRLGSINRTSQFLESVCTQLIAKYRLPYSELPPDANQNKAFLEKLLSEVSEQLKPGERLVIVVDALDEVDLESQDKSANILYLPRYLPKNVYFVISRRRGVDLLFVVDTPKHLFDLMAKEYADRSLQDVQTYIRQHVNQHERLRQWIEANSLTVEDFITQLADKSENNFMYLRCVLVEIEDGIYQDSTIESLPQGLENYYKDHWRLMGMTSDPPPLTKFRIVYVLSENPEPIPYRDIVQIIKSTGEQEAEFNVQYVLEKWKQFLHNPIMYGQTFYRFYHDSYRRFLENREDVKAAGITIEDIKTLMPDSEWQELYGDG
ncbi:ATP-binding protein [Microcoleus sp. A003_D6]|uniref:ATP-binding protein n=1 Tax=Microcoleus sp. A003_D6 TaxID=3055266 RepID=UPI002FD332C7